MRVENYDTVPLKDVIEYVENTPDAVILRIGRDHEGYNYHWTIAKRCMRTNVLFGNEAMIRVKKAAFDPAMTTNIQIDTLLTNGNTKSETVRYENGKSDNPIIRCIEDDFGISLMQK